MNSEYPPKLSKEHLLNYYQKNEVKFSVGFFIAGFLFDVFTLSQVDDLFSIAQQIVYLFLIGSILYFDLLEQNSKFTVPIRIKKVWDYRQIILHFIFGSLLSVYSLFYFKSASILSSFLFIGIMSLILIANELSRIQNMGLWIKFGLYALCLNAFFSIIFPTILGFIGWIPFILSTSSTLLVFYFVFKKFIKNEITIESLKKSFIFPIVITQILFVSFYTLGWIPPVPLSVKFMGVYHNVERKEGNYFLSHERPWWRFWHNGDQKFLAHPGDRIYIFAKIYSPARFEDDVIIRWVRNEGQNGWVTWDRIPIKITGGREEGFRGFAFKSNYQEGDWRVQLETTDGREIGRLYLTIINDPDPARKKEFQTSVF